MSNIVATLFRLPIVREQFAEIVSADTVSRAQLIARREKVETEAAAQIAVLKSRYAEATRRRQELWREYNEALSEERRASGAVDGANFERNRQTDAIDGELRRTARVLVPGTKEADDGKEIDAVKIATTLSRDLRNLAGCRANNIPHQGLREAAELAIKLPERLANVDEVLQELEAVRRVWLPETKGAAA